MLLQWKTSEENLGVARCGIDGSLGDAFPGEEWTRTAGDRVAKMASCREVQIPAGPRMKGRSKTKIRSVFSVVFEEAGEDLAIDFKDLGS